MQCCPWVSHINGEELLRTYNKITRNPLIRDATILVYSRKTNGITYTAT